VTPKKEEDANRLIEAEWGVNAPEKKVSGKKKKRKRSQAWDAEAMQRLSEEVWGVQQEEVNLMTRLGKMIRKDLVWFAGMFLLNLVVITPIWFCSMFGLFGEEIKEAASSEGGFVQFLFIIPGACFTYWLIASMRRGRAIALTVAHLSTLPFP
jgi:hypothetical protein